MRLRDELVAPVPCWPNTAEVRAELEGYELHSLLVIYTNWATPGKAAGHLCSGLLGRVAGNGIQVADIEAC
jgi:hypothetical protein